MCSSRSRGAEKVDDWADDKMPRLTVAGNDNGDGERGPFLAAAGAAPQIVAALGRPTSKAESL